MATKVVGYQFSEKLEVRDPHTGKKDKKHLKPFMVNNSVNVFEKKKIVLNPEDDILKEQLGSYVVKSISQTGMPTYTDDNEHAVDALNLCLLIFEQKYGDLMKRVVSTRILGFEQIDMYADKIPSRELGDNHDKLISKIKIGSQDAYVKDYSLKGAKRSKKNHFSRGTF